MKFIQIENTWVNVSNVTHFEFSPSAKTDIGGSPAELSIEVVGNNPLRFFGADAETGYDKLKAALG